MYIILQRNIFEFHDGYWKQNVGAAMGCKPVPNYANIFMATIDKAIKQLIGSEAFSLLKRFLDDYFGIFNGSTKELHRLLDKINLINPSIQLTMNHTSIENEPREDRCECPPI